jgi:hypothetical protein
MVGEQDEPHRRGETSLAVCGRDHATASTVRDGEWIGINSRQTFMDAGRHAVDRTTRHRSCRRRLPDGGLSSSFHDAETLAAQLAGRAV